MKIKTRFAPSPTGELHIGGVRTAIFNWLFARKNHGNFYLRIEDTDQERSKKKYVKSIIDGLQSLGLNWDKEIIIQSNNRNRHLEVVNELIHGGMAYYCYKYEENTENFKPKKNKGKFISSIKDKNRGIKLNKPVVRLKVPLDGCVSFSDKVIGKITVKNDTIGDFIILRSDGTPTYNIACVVDDHDMEISHIIRGNDHLTNTFKQIKILDALGWKKPIFAHLPLIHAEDGTKMSKRNSAISITEYYKEGYLPEAIFNYLLRLGWSLGNEEIINIPKALNIFDLNGINKSPARIDNNKLKFINQFYIKISDDRTLYSKIIEKFDPIYIDDEVSNKIFKLIPLIKTRGNTINQLADFVKIFIPNLFVLDYQSAEFLQNKEHSNVLKHFLNAIENNNIWCAESIKQSCMELSITLNLKNSIVMKTLRAAVLGTFNSPPIFETLEIFSKREVVNRIKSVCQKIS